MKTHNKNIAKVIVIFLLIGLIGTFTHCVPQATKEVGDGAYQSNTPTNTTKDEGQEIAETEVSIGVKNHEQILQSMSAVTGIDAFSNTSIMSIYRQVETTLPTENDVKVYTTTSQIAVTKLAAEFCFQLTTTTYATQRMAIWPTLNLTALSGTAFNVANEKAFIADTVRVFWGNMLTQEEFDIANNEMMTLINNLIANQNTAAATQRTVRGACTAALSSAYVTLL
jgi:hypothetical protein